MAGPRAFCSSKGDLTNNVCLHSENKGPYIVRYLGRGCSFLQRWCGEISDGETAPKGRGAIPRCQAYTSEFALVNLGS